MRITDRRGAGWMASARMSALLAGVVALVGAFAQAATSVPEVYERLGNDPGEYWNNRLLASMILSSTGLFFAALALLLGAYLVSSTDRGTAFAGRALLALSALPQLASVINLLVLTPEDWTHAITHVLIVLLIGFALIAARQPRDEPG